MRKIALLSTIIILILAGFVLLNSISISSPSKDREYNIPINQFI